MLSFNTFLIPLLAGFLFVRYCIYTRYRSIRDNGYVILFKSAVYGVISYGFGFIIWRVITLDDGISARAKSLFEWLHEFLIYPEIIPAILAVIVLGGFGSTINYIVVPLITFLMRIISRKKSFIKTMMLWKCSF